jgi:hypothetical protein
MFEPFGSTTRTILTPDYIYELDAPPMNNNEDNKYAKVDQGAINYTQSQAGSTNYTRSLADILTRDRSTMEDTGDDRMSRVSMYTYNTTDKAQYLRQDSGRVSVFILSSELHLTCWIQSFNTLNEAYSLPSGMCFLPW